MIDANIRMNDRQLMIVDKQKNPAAEATGQNIRNGWPKRAVDFIRA
jgi:hypothetical protein